MWYFPAGKPSGPMEIPSISTTARRIPTSRWPLAAYALCSPGSTCTRVRKTRTGCSAGEENEHGTSELAELAAASTLDATQMPALRLGPIQAGRVAFLRRTAQYVCAATGSLHVLLEAVLLVRLPCSKPSMKHPQACGARVRAWLIYSRRAE